MKKLLFLLLMGFSLFLTLTGYTQHIEDNGVTDKSVDYGRLVRIDTVINEYLKKGWLNGAVTLVVREGKIIQYKAYGYSDAESRRVMRKDDLFRLASQTKAVVSVAIMILYEEGKIRLDQSVADFVPGFRHPRVLDTYNAADTSYTTVPARREITIRDLLTHTSGLDYAGIGSDKMKAIYAKARIPVGFGTSDGTLKEKMEALARLPLVHQPGEKWTYGLNMDLLGCIVEIVSGKRLDAFFSERIFRPLGMNDTYFNVPASKASRLAKVYTEDSLHHLVRWTKEKMGVDPDYPLQDKSYFSGGADLTGTAYDYAIFLQMLLNGGKYNGVRLLSPRTVEMMTSNQLSFAYNGVDGFGLSFGLTGALSGGKGPRNEGSFSWGGFFGTTYWVDPKSHLLCVFMRQQPNSHGEITNLFEQIIYASLL